MTKGTKLFVVNLSADSNKADFPGKIAAWVPLTYRLKSAKPKQMNFMTRLTFTEVEFLCEKQHFYEMRLINS